MWQGRNWGNLQDSEKGFYFDGTPWVFLFFNLPYPSPGDLAWSVNRKCQTLTQVYFLLADHLNDAGSRVFLIQGRQNSEEMCIQPNTGLTWGQVGPFHCSSAGYLRTLASMVTLEQSRTPQKAEGPELEARVRDLTTLVSVIWQSPGIL